GVLEIKLVVGKGKARVFGFALFIVIIFGAGRALLLARVDAEENVVRVIIGLVYIVRIVGGDNGHVVFAGKLQQHLVGLYLVGYVVALQLHIVVVAKQVQPPFKHLFGLLLTLAQNGARHLRRQAAGSGYQPLVVLQYQFLIYTRILTVHTLY